MKINIPALRPGEGKALVWSFAYFFCLLAGYYVLRPLRDEMGVAGGVRNLQWLFTATFLTMLAAVPIYGALVARLPRRRFLPLVYHFFVVNLAIFWFFLFFEIEKVITARVFFIWVSVFNLFAVSVFWSFMADLFTSDQGKRLFAYIAAGGSAGALAGPALTVLLVERLGTANLLLVAAAFLEIAVLCVQQLESVEKEKEISRERKTTTIGGGVLDGLKLALRSPYLLGILLWVSLLSVVATFLYFQQAGIVADYSNDPAVRTRIFATVDLVVGVLTLAVQGLATSKLIERFGVGAAFAFLPLVFAAGFAALAAAPTLTIVIAFTALQRTANFAISNPAREVMFTVVARDEKYKAKNVIDVVAVRGADAGGGWVFAWLREIGLEARSISLVAIPIAAAGALLAWALGQAQEARARAQASGGGQSQDLA